MSSIPSTFKAAYYGKAGEPITVKEIDQYKPEGDEVLVKVIATAINPVDYKVQYGGFIPLPNILGSDAAGEVVSTGPSAQGFKAGDRVFFQGKLGDPRKCTFQQYTIQPAPLLGHTPKNVSDEEASGLSLAAIAAVTQLYAEEGIFLAGGKAPWAQGGDQVGKGKAIAIVGGSASVGQYAIQLARLSGFSTIVTNASSKHESLLKKLGATHVLDRSHSTATDFVSALGAEQTFAGIVDAISSPDTQKLAVEIYQAANKHAGSSEASVVAIVQRKDEEAEKLGQGSQPPVQIKPVMGAGHADKLRHLSEGYYKALGGEDGWLATGKYFPNKPEVTSGGLNALQEALDKNKKGVSGVKVVIRPHDE